jgi:hypothetical protein
MRKGLVTTTTTTTIATAAMIIASLAMLMMTTTTTVVYAQTLPENMTATTTTATNATTTAAPTNLEFEDEPFAESRFTPVSQNVINETQQVELLVTFIPGGSVLHGQVQLITEDGSESAIALFTEFSMSESTTGISLVRFITNSTGTLAPLNNMITVALDEEQPDGSITARYFEWEESVDEDDDDDEDDDGETEEGEAE